MLRLRNRLLPLLRAASPGLASPIHSSACRLLSTSTSTSTATVPAPFSLDDYLVAACGITPAQAREVSKKAFKELSRESNRPLVELSSRCLISASNPDAILALLSGAGLSRADIAAVVSTDPLLLRASVKNIGPRLVALRDRVGLSPPQIARFLKVASHSLRGCDVAPKVEFFISFFGSFDRVLVAAKRNWSLLKVSLERFIKPNIALFHQRGVPDVAQVCFRNTWVLTSNPEHVKEILLRAEELGVAAASPLFREAVATVAGVSSEKVAAKLEFFKRTLGCSHSEVSTAVSRRPSILGLSDATLLRKIDFFKRTLGCSHSEVSTAVSRMPSILGLSEATLLRKIDFLINGAGMEPQYILERPILLAFSLEKRLVPRHHVMKVLQEKGLLNCNMNLFSLAHLTEEAFKSKFIDCHKNSVPGLADAYAAASASIVPLECD